MASQSSNLTAGFVDLATYDEIEKYMYGGSEATAYFIRDTRKATWFTQVPVALSRAAGSPAFGQEWSVTVSRAGDYLLHTWLRVQLPEVTVTTPTTKRLRWTRNFMHNLIRDCSISFNDLPAAKFDNYHLDFYTAFTVPASKRVGYDNMIGNSDNLTQGSATLPATTLNLPLPFFYTRDSGVALPTAAIPYNDMRINFSFRNWTELLIAETINPTAGTNPHQPATSADVVGGTVTLGNTQVWGNYAIVSNSERTKMGRSPRDILIEQVQTAPRHSYNPSTNPSPSIDLRFSHAIKALFFAARNTTCASEWSNYSSASPIRSATGSLQWKHANAYDPIALTTLIYENTHRLSQMGSDYFSLMTAWYQPGASIPIETGYHLYSYSLNFLDVDPCGSTNYGKLTNVSISPEASTEAKTGAAGSGSATSGMDYKQSYEFSTTVVSNNVIRVSGGALGFPVL